MKAIVQRVSRASVVVDAQTVGSIGRGLLVLAAVQRGDDASDRRWMADKLVNLRIFPDADGRFDRSLLDIAPEGAGVLLVSNFTVAGSTRKGRRPSFDDAMRPPEAEAAFDALVEEVRQRGVTVHTGTFGAHMDVSLVNDGPVTLVLDSRE
ncbi:MAG: D-aminoacyl-tRNA deacylase [Planctomycetota bacterium]